MAEGYEPMPHFNGWQEIDDCNKATILGRSYIATGVSTTNKPTSSGYYFIICIGQYGKLYSQLAILLNTLEPTFWVRTNNNQNIWGDWKQIQLL